MAARVRLTLSCLFALAMLIEPVPAARPAYAAAFIVNSTLDEPDANLADGLCLSTPSNLCTLRAAIQQNNATAANNTITLPAGTFTLTRAGQNEDLGVTGDLDIKTAAVTSIMAITGAGAKSTIIDGAGLDRVFDVDGPGLVTMSDLRVRGGAAGAGNFGGGIQNRGALTLQRVSVSNNSAERGGGISNAAGGTLVLDASVLDSNVGGFLGGGIANEGNLTLLNGAAAVNNIAFSGGGILNFETGTITGTDVFIASNVANNGRGGGINSAGQLTLNRFTVLGNQATGFADSVASVFSAPAQPL